MSKLDDTITKRQEARSHLLEAKRKQAELAASLEAANRDVTRYSRELVALTTDVGQLLHADLAGIVGKGDANGSDQPSA